MTMLDRGWRRIAEDTDLPALLRVMAWTAVKLGHDSAYLPVPQAHVARVLGLSQPQVSRCMTMLRGFGWLEGERVGREWRYRLSPHFSWRGTASEWRAELAARRDFAAWTETRTGSDAMRKAPEAPKETQKRVNFEQPQSDDLVQKLGKPRLRGL